MEMLKGQITLTVAGGKKLIARSIILSPKVAWALKNGRILLIGGTTVSAVSEGLGFGSLWIAGRILPGGTRTAGPTKHTSPHTLLITKGHPEEADTAVEDITAALGAGDLIITGANALFITDDADTPGYFPGVAALACAARDGGARGEALRLAGQRGVTTFIACGLEKLLPGDLETVLKVANRNETDLAMGAVIDLLPLQGRIITELEALGHLFEVKATTIAGGGILGGEGCRVFSIEGPETKVRQAFNYARTLVDATTSADEVSLISCCPPCRHCGRHKGCVYFHESIRSKDLVD